jgi:hypothetical protein
MLSDSHLFFFFQILEPYRHSDILLIFNLYLNKGQLTQLNKLNYIPDAVQLDLVIIHSCS